MDKTLLEYINNILYLLGFLVGASLFFLLPSRFSAKKFAVLGVLLIIWTYGIRLENGGTAKLLLDLMYIVFALFLLYDEKISFLVPYTLGMASAQMMLLLLSRALVSGFTYIAGIETVGRDFRDMCSMLFSLLFLFVLGIIIRKKFRRGLHTLAKGYLILFLVLLVANSAVAVNLEAVLEYVPVKTGLYHGMYIIVILGMFIQIGVIILLAFSRTSFHEQMLITKRYLDEQADHYLYLENRERETRKFRHDMENHMYMLTALAGQGKIKELEEYIRQINGTIAGLEKRINTGNGVADAIFNKFDHEAQMKNISLSVTGHFPAECYISAYDLCIILSNLLGNALCAEEEYGGACVQADIRYTDTEVIICVENDSKAVLPDKKHKLQTSKADKINHGFGLENVKECVERNHGYMDIQIMENRFKAILSLNNGEREYENSSC